MPRQATDIAHRFGARRGGRLEFAGDGNLAGSTCVAERSPKASGNWFADSLCFSDRAPYRARFRVSTMARRLSFSSRRAAFNASKRSGS